MSNILTKYFGLNRVECCITKTYFFLICRQNIRSGSCEKLHSVGEWLLLNEMKKNGEKSLTDEHFH